MFLNMFSVSVSNPDAYGSHSSIFLITQGDLHVYVHGFGWLGKDTHDPVDVLLLLLLLLLLLFLVAGCRLLVAACCLLLVGEAQVSFSYCSSYELRIKLAMVKLRGPSPPNKKNFQVANMVTQFLWSLFPASK